MCHLMNRAYRALGSDHQIKLDPDSIIPDNDNPDDALSYLCQLVKYFRQLRFRDSFESFCLDKIYCILKTKPIDVDKWSNIFTRVFRCYTSASLTDLHYILVKLRESILDNCEKAPQKKIQLLLVIQSFFRSFSAISSFEIVLNHK